MIFVGDIALPFKGAIKFADMPEELYSGRWFGNLEGPIVAVDNYGLNAVYNHQDAISELLAEFRFEGFGLANNHIFDTGSLHDTLAFLENNKIKYCGIGLNLQEANREIVIEEPGVEIVIVNFGWEVIQCEIAKGNRTGVNPLERGHVIHTVERLVKKYPDSKIVAYMHWSYELEAEPQPFERELARKLIDLGAAGVIGCHPHRIGGFEIYNDRPIVYSLGNWMFRQHHFFNKRLKFPNFCAHQMAFDWNLSNNTFQFHFFEYTADNTVIFRGTENSDQERVNRYTPFANLSNREYKQWYKTNHYHKNKGLPIYKWEDSSFEIFLKNKLIKFRDFILKQIFKKGK